MFKGCENLTIFKADLKSLTSGQAMFSGCTGLTDFEADLSSITDINQLFSDEVVA
jgi:hypothetical protein